MWWQIIPPSAVIVGMVYVPIIGLPVSVLNFKNDFILNYGN